AVAEGGAASLPAADEGAVLHAPFAGVLRVGLPARQVLAVEQLHPALLARLGRPDLLLPRARPGCHSQRQDRQPHARAQQQSLHRSPSSRMPAGEHAVPRRRIPGYLPRARTLREVVIPRRRARQETGLDAGLGPAILRRLAHVPGTEGFRAVVATWSLLSPRPGRLGRWLAVCVLLVPL